MQDEPQVTEEAEESGGAEPDVAALQAERDELFDRLQRLAAEFDNYRKRTARDAASLTTRANERRITSSQVRPCVCSMRRAITSVSRDVSKMAPSSWSWRRRASAFRRFPL